MKHLFTKLCLVSYIPVENGIANLDKSAYTWIGDRVCNGWRGISLGQCKSHCTNNDLPSGCTDEGKRCKYVRYTQSTKLCHLLKSGIKLGLYQRGTIYEKGDARILT